LWKTFDDIIKELLSYVANPPLAGRAKLTDINIGSAVRTFLEAVAAKMEEFYFLLQFYTNLFFVDTSFGQWLDRRLADLGMTRRLGSVANGVIIIGRDTPAPIGVLVPAGTIFQTEDGSLIYQTETETRLNVGDLQTEAFVSAQEAGAEYNLPAGTVLKQAGIAITGLEWIIIKIMGGGQDMETDEEFRSRIPEHFESLARACEPAILYAAQSVSGVKAVTAKPNMPGKGWFTLYIDDGSGAAPLELLRSVRAKVEEYCGFTIQFVVDTATLVNMSIKIKVITDSDVETVKVVQDVRDAITGLINVLPMGKALTVADLYFVARGIDGVINIHVISPTQDVIPAETEALRVSDESLEVTL